MGVVAPVGESQLPPSGNDFVSVGNLNEKLCPYAQKDTLYFVI